MFISHEGKMSLAEAMEARGKLDALLAAKRWSRVIVDVTTVIAVPKGMELLALGKVLTQALPRNSRIALVVRPDQVKHARLVEHMARNGSAFLTFFTDAGKAETWVQGAALAGQAVPWRASQQHLAPRRTSPVQM